MALFGLEIFMGEGNSHRQRGTGKGTNQAWRKRFGIEGEPEASNFFTEPGDKASKAEIIDLNSRKPVRADALHANPTVSESGERTSVYRTGPTWETAVRKPSPEKSAEDQLVEIEAKIKSKDFSEAEREFFETMVRKYPGELRRAKEKIEKRGGTVNEKWANIVKISYIDDITRAGLNKDRWGNKIPLAPEKAELLKKYLELKLPVEIPEEKTEITQENSERKEEKLISLSSPIGKGEFSEKRKFSDKQLENLGYLLEVARESSGKLERSDLEKIIGELILEEFVVPRKIFAKDKIADAVEWVMKGIK